MATHSNFFNQFSFIGHLDCSWFSALTSNIFAIIDFYHYRISVFLRISLHTCSQHCFFKKIVLASQQNNVMWVVSVGTRYPTPILD